MVKGLISILADDEGVQELVGQNAAETKYKVYPVVAPQSEKAPYITVTLAGGVRTAKGCGRQYNFVVVSVAESYDEADAIDGAVIAAFEDVEAGTYEDIKIGFVNEASLSVDGFNMDHQLYTRQSTFVCQLGE